MSKQQMADAVTLRAGDSIVKTLTFTLAAGEDAARITLLLTRMQANSEHSAVGRARCIVLECDPASPAAAETVISSAGGLGSPRARFQAELRGVVPVSICGGSYGPVFCVFAYRDGRPATGFEVDANQRFAIEVADDAASVDAGPSINGFA
jgi:hypothetical protein